MGEPLRESLEDLSTLLCEFVPRLIEDLVGDFEFAIFVDGWWPETFRNGVQVSPRNMVALVAGRIGGAIFAKHFPTAFAFSWDIPRYLVGAWKDRTNQIRMVEAIAPLVAMRTF